MTVWVAHEVKDDIRPAERFGELRYVNKFYIHGDELGQASIGPSTFNAIPAGYWANMRRCYAEFHPGADYLLIAGDHLQLLALTALLVGKRGFLDVLRWDRQLRDYIPVRLSSGIVPPRPAMLVSGTDIGENEHGESRIEETRRAAQAVAIEGPVFRNRWPKPPPQDDS
jgi:hypothetical protein